MTTTLSDPSVQSVLHRLFTAARLDDERPEPWPPGQSYASATPHYVRGDPASGYVSVSFPVEDGMEVSCRAAWPRGGLAPGALDTAVDLAGISAERFGVCNTMAVLTRCAGIITASIGLA
jgi:hypothetical protein